MGNIIAAIQQCYGCCIQLKAERQRCCINRILYIQRNFCVLLSRFYKEVFATIYIQLRQGVILCIIGCSGNCSSGCLCSCGCGCSCCSYIWSIRCNINTNHRVADFCFVFIVCIIWPNPSEQLSVLAIHAFSIDV